LISYSAISVASHKFMLRRRILVVAPARFLYVMVKADKVIRKRSG